MSDELRIITPGQAFNRVMLGEFADAPCMLCKPKTLGECGHPREFADDDWLRGETDKHMREFGRRLAIQRERLYMNLFIHCEATIDGDGNILDPLPGQWTDDVH
jgi:hypothetical protein